MKKVRIAFVIITSLLVFALIVCAVFACLVFRTEDSVSCDVTDWMELEKSFTYLPSIEELGEYTDLECKYQHREFYIFQSDAYILKASYSEEEFLVQKNRIQNEYVFQDVVVDYGENRSEKNTAFILDGFSFCMLSEDEYNLNYPQYMTFVGVSEESHEIAFVYFEDVDLDYIDQTWEAFLVDECGWE